MKLKNLLVSLVILSCIALPVTCFAKQVSDSTIRTLVGKYKAHNYLGCIQDSFTITKTNPSNVYAYYYRGMSYAQLGKKEAAITAFKQVQSLNSNKVLVQYAKKGEACLTSADACAAYTQKSDELDQFIKSNKFYDKSVQAEVNKKKLDRIKDNINDELGPNTNKSEAPSNEEIANAVKTLAKLGYNPMTAMGSYSNPEMMQMNMMLGDGNGQQNNMNNMLPYLLMSQGQNGSKNISPEMIQTMMMSQMPTY